MYVRTIRKPGYTFDTFFNRTTDNLYTGGGIRIHLKSWYKTCLRVDNSFNPNNYTSQGFTFGFGQFF